MGLFVHRFPWTTGANLKALVQKFNPVTQAYGEYWWNDTFEWKGTEPVPADMIDLNEGTGTFIGTYSGGYASVMGSADAYTGLVSTAIVDVGTGQVISSTPELSWMQFGHVLELEELSGAYPVYQTDIATLATQTGFTLTNGPVDDDAINNWMIVIRSEQVENRIAVGVVNDYTGATKTVALLDAPGFTIGVGDFVSLLPWNPLLDAKVSATQAQTLSPVIVDDRLTWNAPKEGSHSDDIVTVTDAFDGTLAAAFDNQLGPGTSVESGAAVSITGLTPTNIVIAQDRRSVHFDVSGMTSNTTYTAVVSATATDTQPLRLTGTLKIE